MCPRLRYDKIAPDFVFWATWFEGFPRETTYMGLATLMVELEVTV